MARMGEKRNIYRVSVGKPEGNNHLGDPGVDGRLILRWIFRNWEVGVRTGSSWLRKATQVVGTCDCGNEPSGSIKCLEFLD